MKDNELFAPPGERWQPLDPHYLLLLRVVTGLKWLILLTAVMVAVVLFLDDVPRIIIGVISLSFIAFRVWRQGAIYRSWGFAERESDLFITHGVWRRKLAIIPYGRMQSVTIASGPIERLAGVATVRLITAAAAVEGTIPGVGRADAQKLRERLLQRGELQAAGL